MLSCSHCWVLDSGVKQVLATPEQSTATVTVLDQGTDLDQTQFQTQLHVTINVRYMMMKTENSLTHERALSEMYH